MSVAMLGNKYRNFIVIASKVYPCVAIHKNLKNLDSHNFEFLCVESNLICFVIFYVFLFKEWIATTS
ncbi:hypothetical protein [Helicobacter fennelliae]|nr:hypothetical protein [Helicobacter fennelliae]